MFTFLYVIFFLTNYFHILLYLFSINSMTFFYNTIYWFLSHLNYKSYLFFSILFSESIEWRILKTQKRRRNFPLSIVLFLFYFTIRVLSSFSSDALLYNIIRYYICYTRSPNSVSTSVKSIIPLHSFQINAFLTSLFCKVSFPHYGMHFWHAEGVVKKRLV